MKKIIYLGHEYPLPNTSGGQKGIWSISKELLPLIQKYNGIMLYTNLNIENPESLPKSFDGYYEVIDNRLKLKGVINQLDKLRNTFLSIYPRAFERTVTDKLINKIEEIKPDIIISDGINFYPILKKYKDKCKIIYIANNIEAELAGSIYKFHKGFTSLCYFLQFVKIKIYEKQLLNFANKIICVSSSDFYKIKSQYPTKTDLCPHQLCKKTQGKRKLKKTLLFTGTINFPPNYDAVKWIAEELAPKLDKDIKIYITGTPKEKIPKEWKRDNIEFLGFVSKEKLTSLFKEEGAFICPIILGSGVKVKILEALEYDMPVIATKESLAGLSYIPLTALIDRKNINKTSENINNLLKNEKEYYDLISKTSRYVENFCIDRNNKLANLIFDFVDNIQ